MKKNELQDIKEYEGLYGITKEGNVWSYKKNNRKGKWIKKSLIGGYLHVTLTKNGTRKIKKVHRILAETFIHNPNSFSQVNHIDGDKLNNALTNLEWCSPRMNTVHAVSTGLIPKKNKCVGVIFVKNTNKWRARIVFNKKRIHLGNFNTEEEAYSEYLKAIDKLDRTGSVQSRAREKVGKYIGITLDKLTGKWRARITINKIKHYLGSYNTEEEAFTALNDFKRKAK